MVTLTGQGGQPLAEVADDLVTATRLDEPRAPSRCGGARSRSRRRERRRGAGLLEAAGQALLEAGAETVAVRVEAGRLLGTG